MEKIMDWDELVEKVSQWRREHNIDNPVMQYAKITEEVGELAHELTRGRTTSREAVDAIGDILVTVLVYADIVSIDARTALHVAYKEISGRTGVTKDGSFVKDE